MCRECGDKAHYYVQVGKAIMPWYYCLDCACTFRKLGHVALFRYFKPGEDYDYT